LIYIDEELYVVFSSSDKNFLEQTQQHFINQTKVQLNNITIFETRLKVALVADADGLIHLNFCGANFTQQRKVVYIYFILSD
jgi:hypothetical protein